MHRFHSLRILDVMDQRIVKVDDDNVGVSESCHGGKGARSMQAFQ
jgi:hypothetical protein